jgi:protein-disulfide isomerase
MTGTSCTGPVVVLPGSPLEVLDSDVVMGSADAPVTVVEYTSLLCYGCSQFALNEFETIRQRYIETGQVRWVFRHLIPATDTDSVNAACAEECAGDQGQFTAYRDLLYQNAGDFSDETLEQYATDLGLDLAAFDACRNGDEKAAKIQRDYESAAALGIPSTPRFFVGAEDAGGHQTADDLSIVIERHLSAG